jgi:hypothetical protein
MMPMGEQRLGAWVVVTDGTTLTFRATWRAMMGPSSGGYALIAASAIVVLAAGRTAAGLITWMCVLTLGSIASLLGGIEDALCAGGRGVLTPVKQIRIVRPCPERGYRQPAGPTDRIEADGRSWPIENVVGVDIGEFTDGSEEGPSRRYTVSLVLRDEALLTARTASSDDARATAKKLRDAIGKQIPMVDGLGPFPPTGLGIAGTALLISAIGAMLASMVLPMQLGFSLIWANVVALQTALGYRAALTRTQAPRRRAQLRQHIELRYAEMRRIAR